MARKNPFPLLLAVGLLILGGFISLQCTDDKSSSPVRTCATDDDCNPGEICQDKHCIKIACVTDDDCPRGLVCQDGNCVKNPADQDTNTPCNTDADCGAEDQICLNGTCAPKYPTCPPEENCYPCQTCDKIIGLCQGEPCFDNTDGDEEKTTDSEEAQQEQEPDLDDNTQPPDTEEDQNTQQCRRDDECPDGMICSPQLRCVPDCTTTGCEPDEGNCNPRTGHCEWCDPPCDEGEECNYNSTAWYCGSPCEPPCPDGYACQGGQCVELRCPDRCPPGYSCSGSTGYICRPNENEPEYRSVPAPVQGSTCLPPTAPCIEGVSECCSGACIMGHCM